LLLFHEITWRTGGDCSMGLELAQRSPSIHRQVPKMTGANTSQKGSALARDLNGQLQRCLVRPEGLGGAITDINLLGAATPRLF
jgi:hypothetical protein